MTLGIRISSATKMHFLSQRLCHSVISRKVLYVKFNYVGATESIVFFLHILTSHATKNHSLNFKIYRSSPRDSTHSIYQLLIPKNSTTRL